MGERAGRAGKPRVTFSDETLALIRRLVSEGVRSADIASRIGTTYGSLRVTCARRGISLRQPQGESPRHSRPQYAHFRLPVEILQSYRTAANEQARTPDQLILAVLVTVAQDNLFDAVLG